MSADPAAAEPAAPSAQFLCPLRQSCGWRLQYCRTQKAVVSHFRRIHGLGLHGHGAWAAFLSSPSILSGVACVLRNARHPLCVGDACGVIRGTCLPAGPLGVRASHLVGRLMAAGFGVTLTSSRASRLLEMWAWHSLHALQRLFWGLCPYLCQAPSLVRRSLPCRPVPRRTPSLLLLLQLPSRFAAPPPALQFQPVPSPLPLLQLPAFLLPPLPSDPPPLSITPPQANPPLPSWAPQDSRLWVARAPRQVSRALSSS